MQAHTNTKNRTLKYLAERVTEKKKKALIIRPMKTVTQN